MSLKRLFLTLACDAVGADPQNLYMLRSNKKDGKDGEFRSLFQRPEFRRNSLLDYSRAYVLYQFLMNVRSLEGSLAECGTYRGGSAWLMGQVDPAPLHVFDTFAGMPDLMTKHDTHRPGDLADTSVAHVRALLGERAHIHQGLFSDTLHAVDREKFKFVHCDADIYESVLHATEFFYQRMVPGGILVYDDYGWATTRGAQAAVLEFFADRPELPIYLPTRQAVVIKQ